MDETEYRSLESFADLPLYDEDDPRCESIDRPSHDPGFSGVVREATDLAEAESLVAQDDMLPKGGVRFKMGETERIFAYFWQRRI